MMHLRVDRVVLDGVPLERGQSARLKEALEERLGELLQCHGLKATLQSGMASGLIGPAVQVPAESPPVDLGRAIAGSVHSALNAGI